jgi:hypothetical protein
MILRPGIGWRIERSHSEMRVVDDFLKSVAFIAEIVDSDTNGDNLDYVATGFFVTIPILQLPGRSFHYFVTAAHVARSVIAKNIWFVANNKSGGVSTIKHSGASTNEHQFEWFYHPTDPHADVAVVNIAIDPALDIVCVPLDLFVNPAIVAQRGIGVGDEVFTVGLFSHAPGRSRNMPIVRYGTIAMLPDEEIYVGSGFTSAHLIEARSIGGLSGSPVFVRETRGLSLPDRSHLQGIGNQYFLGLMYGHWDMDESQMNKPLANTCLRGVNMGIAIVVPAGKILETINHPSLVDVQQRTIAYHLASLGPD